MGDDDAAVEPPANAPNANNTQAGAGPIATPPPEPAVAETTTAATAATEDVEMGESAAEAKEEGRQEREAEDVEGEMKREGEAGGIN